jgi:hypothetical protein
MVIAENVQLVGNYALRLIWRDGHATGSLRLLAPAFAGREGTEQSDARIRQMWIIPAKPQRCKRFGFY